MKPETSQPVVHLELHTGNLPRACDFYAQLFGWEPEKIEAGCGSYHALPVGGRSGGLDGGVVECETWRPGWLPYVEVSQIAEATDRARELGARVLLEPREGPAGWRSVVATPDGGEIALWQPKERAEERDRRGPSRLRRMEVGEKISTVGEQELLEAARDGNEDAYGRLVESYRGELHAHCYRMLGSVHDAEDALQEGMLRAWRNLSSFEGRSSLRSWLYRITTNTCLDAIAKRPKRVLPVDYGPAADPHEPPGQPMVESVWIEPFPDETLAIEDGLAGPEARYEQREALELAFVAALQFLPANQRAALIMREVLGFSAKETAESLETSVASINSALQRARKTIEDKLPEESQQQTLRSLGDERITEIVETYMQAWERNDIDTVVSLLSEDVAFTMPPMSTWYDGIEETRIWMTESPMSGDWRWRPIRARANGQEALAFYAWDEEEGAYLPFALNVLTFEGEKISEIDAFINRTIDDPSSDAMANMPDQEPDARATKAAFENFGFPASLPR